MKSIVLSCLPEGSSPQLVRVESTFTSGFPGIHIVGNAKEACREAKDRAKAALESLAYRFGQKRILVNLAPAASLKQSNHFDLPIALSIASLLSEQSSAQTQQKWLFAAELGVNGSLRPCRALIPMALSALRNGLQGLVLAQDQSIDTQVLRHHPPFLDSIKFLHFSHLEEVLRWYFEGHYPPFVQAQILNSQSDETSPSNFDDMILDEELEQLALTCALGKHHLLLRGTPGSGKSMFAQRIRSLLPTPRPQELTDILDIYSRLHETLPSYILQGRIPFRSPHHSSSLTALLGNEREPGELSMAHGGILFLDELPEFRRDLIEALREPLELGRLHISRARGKVSWPADFQLIAACNNCPCGWLGSKVQLCRCSHGKISQYWGKLSGPILDRIDLHFLMPERSQNSQERTYSFYSHGQTQRLKRLLEDARKFQVDRQTDVRCSSNSTIPHHEIFKVSGCSTTKFQKHLCFLESLSLSTRSFTKILRVARTLADLRASPEIDDCDIHKASSWHHSMLAREFSHIF